MLSKITHRSLRTCYSGNILSSHPRKSPILHRYSYKSRFYSDLILSDAQRKTIYALSTPAGKAGVAVIRISGPEALEVWKVLVKTSSRRLPEPWKMQRCKIVFPERQEVLDDGLAVFFKGFLLLWLQIFTAKYLIAPKSFTTEDVLELHIHSGRAIISSVLHALSSLPFCRPAEAGEFTRRAFQGGRLDLTQVEGLKDLINADTESQRRIALQAARVSFRFILLDFSWSLECQGISRAQFEHLRLGIIHCLAMVEALIDFGEGEDLEEGVFEQGTDTWPHLLRFPTYVYYDSQSESGPAQYHNPKTPRRRPERWNYPIWFTFGNIRTSKCR